MAPITKKPLIPILDEENLEESIKHRFTPFSTRNYLRWSMIHSKMQTMKGGARKCTKLEKDADPFLK